MKTKGFLSGFLAIIIALPIASAEAPKTNAVLEARSPHQTGDWQSADRQALLKQRNRLDQDSGAGENALPLLPVIAEFKALIENDPELFMLFTEMFNQIPREPQFLHDATGKPVIRNYHEMLQLMNRIVTEAPEFNQSKLVGFPLNTILNWAMDTPAGAAAFLNEKVNRQLKKILNQWAIFLSSPDSRTVLNDHPENGWFGQKAREAMPTFVEDFISDPRLPYYGFASWDDFFTRRFREGRRPVASPDDDQVIANACESAPYRLAKNVQLRDQFWIKDQPYSLTHLLADDPLAEQFEGGTVYQAFLSALSYHRWHSPVSGRIVKTRLIDGSYYAQANAVGYDPASPDQSQAYITHVASRALVFIEADNPDIGLMAVVFIGMAEVSSNEITVYERQRVKKGDQLGMFHFGGSTHALIFRPGVNLEFDLHGRTTEVYSGNIPVRARIATVQPAKPVSATGASRP